MENNDVIFSNDELEQLIIFGSFDYKAYREKEALDQLENYHPFSFPEEKEEESEDGDVENIPQGMENFNEVSQINNDCNVVVENEVLTSNSAMNDHHVPPPKHVLESSGEIEEGSCEVQKHSTNFQILNQCYEKKMMHENDSFGHTSERNDSPKRSEEGHCVEVVSKPEDMQIEQMKEEFDVVLKENNVQKASSENEVLDLFLSDHVDQVMTQLSISASLLEKELSSKTEDIEARPQIEKVESKEVTKNETKKITEIESIFDYTKGLPDYAALCFSDEKAKAEAEKRKRRNLKKKEKKAKNKNQNEVVEDKRWQPYFCSKSHVLIVFMGVVLMMVLVFKCNQLMVDFSAIEAEV